MRALPFYTAGEVALLLLIKACFENACERVKTIWFINLVFNVFGKLRFTKSFFMVLKRESDKCWLSASESGIEFS